MNVPLIVKIVSFVIVVSMFIYGLYQFIILNKITFNSKEEYQAVKDEIEKRLTNLGNATLWAIIGGLLYCFGNELSKKKV